MQNSLDGVVKYCTLTLTNTMHVIKYNIHDLICTYKLMIVLNSMHRQRVDVIEGTSSQPEYAHLSCEICCSFCLNVCEKPYSAAEQQSESFITYHV